MQCSLLPSQSRASTLLITVLSLCVLSILAGQVLVQVSARSQTVHRSAAWNEALITANAGVDMTVADLGALLPDVRLNNQEGLALGVSPLPLQVLTQLKISTTGSDLLSGLTVSYSPTPLVHGGEGTNKQEAKIFIDVLPISEVLSSVPVILGQVTNLLSNPLGLLSGGPDLQLIRLRSRGTVYLGSNRTADPDPLDAMLRRPSLVWDRLTGKRAAQTSVTREIEVLLRPVLPFQAALTTAGRISLLSTDTVLDSYNSSSSLASNFGLYSEAKRLQHGTLISGSHDVTFHGTLHGDLQTAGSNIVKNERITGSVRTAPGANLPLVQPTWSSSFGMVSPPAGSATVSAGLLGIPARYKFDKLNGALRITRGILGLGTEAEIYVAGDVTGSITVDAGVRAKIYVGGNLRLTAGKMTNGSKLAGNLQIFGVGEDGTDGLRSMEVGLGDCHAAIYAPRHHLLLTGSGHFHGAITAATVTANEGAKIHFDEALGLNMGPVLRFQVASWLEREL